MSIHTSHRAIIGIAATIFLILSMIVAVLPALQASRVKPVSGIVAVEDSSVRRGRELYLKEGCAVCHTQFVRALPVDEPYGRASVAGDYAFEDPPLLGTQRTGPDLTNVGVRQPSEVWNLIHLYNPRAVVPQSVMPGYPWYFDRKARVSEGDITVPVPTPYAKTNGVIVAKQEAIDIVRYLQSLKQAEITQ